MLARFVSAPLQLIPIESIRTNDALQPRVARLVPLKDKGRTETSSAQHIATLRLVLEATDQNHLDPVWIASIGSAELIGEGLHLVDGHHRLTAYKQASRNQIPARIVELDWTTAVVISKLVNCTGRSLALHKQQCLDAAWQYISNLTRRGEVGLPKGESLRSIAGRFGISKNTVSSMLDQLPRVDLSDFSPFSLDPGTGWPRWRYVREVSNPWRTDLPSSDHERLERDAERLARQIMKLVDGALPATRIRALQMLAEDEATVADQLSPVEMLSHFDPAIRPSVPTGTFAVPGQPTYLDI